jgi:hypothetical protein
MPIKIEPRDFARLNTLGNNMCRKCIVELMEGDTVTRIDARLPKYFQLKCLKPY